MKKITLLLVIVLAATTAYNQSSRRTTSVNGNTTRETSSRTSTVKTSTRTSRPSTIHASNSNSSRTARTISGTSNSSTRYRGNTTSHRSSNVRHNNTVHVNHSHRKAPVKKVHHHTTYVYREPVRVNVVWTRDMHHEYKILYPGHCRWNYHYGHHINSVPAREAKFHIGDVTNVYGRVTDIHYIPETDEYMLYFGRFYPRQHFSMIVPGHIARRYSRRPSNYFLNQYVNVTGLISVYEGKPEIIVKRKHQIDFY